MNAPAASRPHRPLPRVVVWAVVVGALGLLARQAWAHFPPAYLGMKVTDDAVTVRLVANYDIFRGWFGVDPSELVAKEATDSAGAASGLSPEEQHHIETVFQDLMKVRIDRIEVQPVFERAFTDSYLDHGQQWEYVNLSLRYPALGKPRQVSFAWFRYEAPGGYAFLTVDAEIEAYGKTTYPGFRETEPEVVWHRPEEIPPPPEVVLPKPRPPPHFVLPVLSAALLPLLVLAFLLARAKGVPPRERWGGLGIGLGLALALSGVAQTEVTLPGGGFEPPKESEAVYTAETLLRNVYRAFDHDKEEEVYDTLAKSVTGSLLERIYLEIHQSLVMQEQGGAVAKVESVEILEDHLLPAEQKDAPWYQTDTRWRVAGKVGHWGHTHQRVNEYEAKLTITLDQGTWKIARMEVLSQQRVDDGQRK